MGVLIFIMDETLRKKSQVSWIFTGSLCNIRVLTSVACIEIKNDEPLAGTVVWGVSFGGVATQFQTAVARRADEAGDIAQSFVVTGWNLAIALAGIVGGVMLETVGERWLPAVLLVLLLATLVVVLRQPRAWAPIAH